MNLSRRSRGALPSFWIAAIVLVGLGSPALLLAVSKVVEVPTAAFLFCAATIVSLAVLATGLHVGESARDPIAAAAWRAHAGSIAHPICMLVWLGMALFPSSPALLTQAAIAFALLHAILGAIDWRNRRSDGQNEQ